MTDEVKEIALWPCQYQAQCKVKNCKAKATVIARGVDSIGRPTGQYELCALYAEQIAERELAKGGEIVRRISSKVSAAREGAVITLSG